MPRPVDEVLFSTMVVGSLPRPQWIRDIVEDRKSGSISRVDADRLFDAAIPYAVSMQEQAGLDYVSDGEWRRESYVKVFAEAVDGFEPDLISGGTIGFTATKYPAVVSKIRSRRPLASSEARFLRNCTDSKVIVAVPSPYTIGRRMWSPDHSKSAYATPEEFMHACIPVVRKEIRDLVELGVDAVQIDDPWLALLVDPDYREREGITDVDREIALSVDCVNSVAEGMDNVFLSVHLCHAHWDRQHASKGPYDLIIGGLGEMNVDRVALELATPDAGGIDVLSAFPEEKMLGLGVIDHTDRHVETPGEVVSRVEAAMEFVPKDRITLNPDCGFSPSSSNPMDFDEAYLKLNAMCQGADMLRQKHG